MNKIKMKLIFGRSLYILHVIVLLFISFLLDKFMQMFTFVLLFNFIHGSFNYRFHSDSVISDPIKAVRACKIITISIEIIYLGICLTLDKSIYSNLLFIFLICLTNALLQFYVLKTYSSKEKLRDLDSLKQMCCNCGLSVLSTNRLIMKYIDGKSYKEIAEVECVDEGTIKKSIQRSRRKLNI